MAECLDLLENAARFLHARTERRGSRLHAAQKKEREAEGRILRLEGDVIRLNMSLGEEEEKRRHAEAELEASRLVAFGLRGDLEACRLELTQLRARQREEARGGVDAATQTVAAPAGSGGGGDAARVGAGVARGSGPPVFRFSGSPGPPAAPGERALPRLGEGRGRAVPAGWGFSFGGARPAGGGVIGGGGGPPAAAGEPDLGPWRAAEGPRGRRRRRRRRARVAAFGGAAPPVGGGVVGLGAAVPPALPRGRVGPRPAAGRPWPPPPLTAAVSIRLDAAAEGASYAEALRRARKEIPLAELGIAGTSVRRAVNGALLIEVPGPGGGERADALAGRLRAVLPDAVVARPSRFGEVRLVGFDESVLPEEVRLALSSCAGCGAGEVRLGALRWGSRGVGSAWARLPLAAAQTAAGVGRVALGWSVARIQLLGDRPLQCHRCWRFGHTRASCSGGVDRSGGCYRCGRTGHIARDCAESESCAVCREEGRDASHRLGGPRCEAARAAAASSAARPSARKWARLRRRERGGQ